VVAPIGTVAGQHDSTRQARATLVCMPLPDGLVAFVKSECETCQKVAPVFKELAAAGVPVTVYSQDDPGFPPGVPVIDDTDLRVSWEHGIEIVPTLMKVERGAVVDTLQGWLRPGWREFTGVAGLGDGLPEYGPGCGSRTLDPGVPEQLAVRFGGEKLRSRRVELGTFEDEVEAAYDRGWTDGLPVVPPTRERVMRMLEGTQRDPGEVVAAVPPDLVECTVEKVAINAVIAGCKPDYLPVVLAAVDAACTDQFNVHGLLTTTYFSGPMVVVNGAVREHIGMNSGLNALGQGNRANATIGRALQLVVRNVGGGRPGGVDRATLGWPGKYTFCLAEDEAGSPWEPLSVERGHEAGVSTVTLFAAGGLHAVVDQTSREPEALARSYADGLRVLTRAPYFPGAVLVVTPEHARVFREGDWSKARLRQELTELLARPGVDMEAWLSQLWFVHAGSTAGMFSAIIPGWIAGPGGSQPVTREVRP
jgi:thiol-disulfide isomerase/thioredoxin